MQNGDNVNHFFNQLDARLGRIEMAIDRIGAQHDIFEERLSARVATLELALARQDGGRKALAGLMAAAATVGGMVATAITSFWPRY
jgi:ABC-type transporter Mla subunit MlaD